MKKHKKVIIYCSLLALFIAIAFKITINCGDHSFSKVSKSHGFMPYVNISSDDKKIIFSYKKNNQYYILSSNIAGTDINQLMEPIKEEIIDPIYYPDKSKALFIAKPKDDRDLKSSLYTIDFDGGNKKRLVSLYGCILETAISSDSKKIYFIKSNSFKNYSPIGRPNFHDFNIYSIDSDGQNLKQLTFENSYELSNLNITSDNKNLIFRDDKGVYLFNLDNKSKTKIDIPIKSSGKKKLNNIYTVALSKDNKSIICTTPTNGENGDIYELYNMDMKSKKYMRITNLNSCITNCVFFNKSNEILFIQNTLWPATISENYQLWKMNLDNHETKKINLDF